GSWRPQHLEHLFAVFAQLRIANAGDTKKVGQARGSRRRDSVERGVVEHDIGGNAGGAGGFEAPPPQSVHRLDRGVGRWRGPAATLARPTLPLKRATAARPAMIASTGTGSSGGRAARQLSHAPHRRATPSSPK